MAFSSDVIAVATSALHAAVNSLPERPNATHVNLLARIILRRAKAGERDTKVLRAIAVAELQSAVRT